MSTCGFKENNVVCGKPSIITVKHVGIDTEACQLHYTISVIDAIEDSRIDASSCQECNKGFMEYRSVTHDKNGFKVWYKCSKCGEFTSEKREVINGSIR